MNQLNHNRNRMQPLLLTIMSSLVASILLIIGINVFNDDTNIVEEKDQTTDQNIWPREVNALNGTISILEKPERILTASVGHDELTVALVKLDKLVQGK